MRNPVSGARRIAFFGGSFDPPHLGHLAVARAALEALKLDTVLFAPVGTQPLKPIGSTASFEDRVAMTRLAIRGELAFSLSLVDAPKPSGAPNYTLDTLRELKKGLPKDGTLYYLMGADSLAGLRLWHGAAEIPFVAPLIVASRPGQPLADLQAVMPPGLTLELSAAWSPAKSDVEVRCYSILNSAAQRASFYLLPGLDLEISASQIRELARARSQAVEGSRAMGGELLPDGVFNYIRFHGLYR